MIKQYMEDERLEMIWTLNRLGHSYQDIADVFNMPRATVYSLVKKRPLNWQTSWIKRGFVNKDLYEATYNAWCGLRQRCTNSNHKYYHRYGGRGIVFDSRWDKFDNFLLDMGIKPDSKLSLDRIDPDGNYEPDNCRWTDAKTQAVNKGKKKTKCFPGLIK